MISFSLMVDESIRVFNMFRVSFFRRAVPVKLGNVVLVFWRERVETECSSSSVSPSVDACLCDCMISTTETEQIHLQTNKQTKPPDKQNMQTMSPCYDMTTTL